MRGAEHRSRVHFEFFLVLFAGWHDHHVVECDVALVNGRHNRVADSLIWLEPIDSEKGNKNNGSSKKKNRSIQRWLRLLRRGGCARPPRGLFILRSDRSRYVESRGG
jgi:hypothetical protein